MDKEISLKDVWVKYRIDFKEDGKVVHEDFWALQGVNLEINKGDVIAIIGENGAGKTTILKLIAGMLKPDRGTVEVNGRVSALMEIGAGFQRELTGKENIYLIASMHGLRREQIDQRCADIIKFADIGRFINAPVKSYSQGMYMRLAFAIAIYMDVEILIIDDVFAVGDAYAQHKCIEIIHELKGQRKTIIFVSHSVDVCGKFCQRAILLKNGRLIKDGMLKDVISCYLMTMGSRKGIGVLQGKHLGFIFNNGKLSLTWNNNLLTKELAGHIMILNDGNRLFSFNGEWEVKENSYQKVVMLGKLWDLPIWQLWDICLDDVKDVLDLRIAVYKNCACDLQEICARFMFNENYKYWVNPVRGGEFEDAGLSNKLSWENVNCEVPPVEFIGLSAPSGDRESLPEIFLSDDVHISGKLLEIKYTDYFYNARILQSKVIFSNSNKDLIAESNRYPIFHLRIKAGPEMCAENNFCNDIRKMMMPKMISDGCELSLKVDCFNAINIYWKDTIITASKGLKTEFYHNRKYYHSSDMNYVVHRVSDKRIDIFIRFIGLPVLQIWNIEFLENGLLSWKVSADIFETVTIRNNKFYIMFLPSYDRWMNTMGEGRISEGISLECQNTIMKNDPCNLIGLKDGSQGSDELPCVLVRDASGYRKFNSIELKMDRHLESGDTSGINKAVASASFLNIDSGESIIFKKGLYQLCDINMSIGEDAIQNENPASLRKEEQLKNGTVNNSVWSIDNGRHKFVFERGMGGIILDRKRITNGFGIYTAVYSKDVNDIGMWYASVDAIWELVNVKKGSLTLRGTWPYLPIVQVWEIKSGHNYFSWNVEMWSFADVSLEMHQVNVMLPVDYSVWFAGERSGSFSNDFAPISWNVFFRERNVNKIVVEPVNLMGASSFPRLSFSCLPRDGILEAKIENSSAVLNCRNIGFSSIFNIDEKEKTATSRHYFKGMVSVD